MENKRLYVQLGFELTEKKNPCAFPLRNGLIELLDAVKQSGSISMAAKVLGFSYRHIWNEINEWEKDLGRELFIRGRGKSGELTDFAQRLLWANKEVQAKYRDQLEDLQAGISLAFKKALSDGWKAILIEGCADLALNILRDNSECCKYPLEINFSSSKDGLHSLAAGDCDLAGFNFPIGSRKGSEAYLVFQPLLEDSDIRLIRFATRIQGFIVPKGNPKGIYSLIDIAEKKALFLNRKSGTGTRILLDQMLKITGVDAKEIQGYENNSESQSLTAVQVASGKADVGISTANVAKEYGLDFIPLVKEVYFLAAKTKFIESEEGKSFLDFLKTFDWSVYKDSLAGYGFEGIGEITTASRVFS